MKRVLLLLLVFLPVLASAQPVKSSGLIYYDSIPNTKPSMPHGSEVAYSRALGKFFRFNLVADDWEEMNAGNVANASDTASFVVYKASHGYNLASYTANIIAVKADYTLAYATTAANTQVAYVVGTPHPDSIEIQFSGLLHRPGHGLPLGKEYFLTDMPAGESDTIPGTVESRTFIVVDSNYLYLSEVGITQDYTIPVVNIPAVYITGNGGDPAAPHDTVIQKIAELFAEVGRIRPGSYLVTNNTTISDNTTYQAAPDAPTTPSAGWIWNGEFVTRIKELVADVDLQDTLYGGLGTSVLTPLVPAGSEPTTAEVATWYQNNFETNGLQLANGAKVYWAGNGTQSDPDLIWEVQDDLSHEGGTKWERIIKQVKGVDDNGIFSGADSLSQETTLAKMSETFGLQGFKMGHFPSYPYNGIYDAPGTGGYGFYIDPYNDGELGMFLNSATVGTGFSIGSNYLFAGISSDGFSSKLAAINFSGSPGNFISTLDAFSDANQRAKIQLNNGGIQFSGLEGGVSYQYSFPEFTPSFDSTAFIWNTLGVPDEINLGALVAGAADGYLPDALAAGDVDIPTSNWLYLTNSGSNEQAYFNSSEFGAAYYDAGDTFKGSSGLTAYGQFSSSRTYYGASGSETGGYFFADYKSDRLLDYPRFQTSVSLATALNSSSTAIPSGTVSGALIFGSDNYRSSQIFGAYTENVSGGNTGGELQFFTTLNGTNTPVKRMTLENDGELTIHHPSNSAYTTLGYYGGFGYDDTGNDYFELYPNYIGLGSSLGAVNITAISMQMYASGASIYLEPGALNLTADTAWGDDPTDFKVSQGKMTMFHKDDDGVAYEHVASFVRSSDVSPLSLFIGRSRLSGTSPVEGVSVLNNDELSKISFGGASGTVNNTIDADLDVSAEILLTATENWNSTNLGGELAFYTTPNGTATPIKRLTIGNDGGVNISAYPHDRSDSGYRENVLFTDGDGNLLSKQYRNGTATITGDGDGEDSIPVSIPVTNMPDASYLVNLSIEVNSGSPSGLELVAYVAAGKDATGFTIMLAEAIETGESVFIRWEAVDY